MKYIKLVALVVAVAFANTSYAQHITYKDLIGTWEKKDSTTGKVMFQFLDSINLTITNANGNRPDATFALSHQGQQTKMTIESKAVGIKIIDEYHINLIDGETVRLENLNTYNSSVQLPTKTMSTTLILKKRKS